jgi:hypothetical protein
VVSETGYPACQNLIMDFCLSHDMTIGLSAFPVKYHAVRIKKRRQLNIKCRADFAQYPCQCKAKARFFMPEQGIIANYH